MFFKSVFKKALNFFGINLYNILDQTFIPIDKSYIRRTRNIRLIPFEGNRRGGKYSYAEWAYVIGIFQTLMHQYLEGKENISILDVGCGTGLLAIASEPFLGNNGQYTGIDVSEQDISFCRNHYPSPSFKFIHFDVNNPAYAPSQKNTGIKWPIDDNSFHIVTALSVWTHFNESDALFYLKEVVRVLKSDGKAIITFFLLDETYEKSLRVRSNAVGRYHMTNQDKWIFDRPIFGSKGLFCPRWAKVPENAIGISENVLAYLMTEAKLKLIHHYQGNWKELPGVFFQDILIFEKA